MTVTFRKSFEKDLKKLKDDKTKISIKAIIEEVENAQSLSEINNLKKLSGSKTYYRIRIGDYRIGVEVEKTTADFIRCLDRKEIYRYFP